MTAILNEPGARPAGADAIPLSVPEIRGNEWAYVKECLDTGWVSSAGAFVDRFEAEVSRIAGTRYAVATASGTAALHVALEVAGVRRNDEVLVSALTFIAPANAVRYVGAWPVFIDAERHFRQLDPDRVADFLTRGCVERGGALWNRTTGRRIAAILPVHILGHPVEMPPVIEAAQRYGLPVIEDATESLGAAWNGQPVGHLGDVACFSFNGNKLVTTGGGGMLVTDNEQWARRARYLTTQAKDDPIEYVHGEVGYNYRLTNLQAAVGVAQLEQLDAFLAAKRRIAARYDAAFRDAPGIRPMRQATAATSAWWMYTVDVVADACGMDSRSLMHALAAQGIQTRPLWQPLHRSPAHADAPPADCPVADELSRLGLSLPCSVGLTAEAQGRVIDAILDLHAEARIR